jgi:hypothetical protein
MISTPLSANMPTSTNDLYDLRTTTYDLNDCNDYDSIETTRKNNKNNTQMMVTFASDPIFWGGGFSGGGSR